MPAIMNLLENPFPNLPLPRPEGKAILENGEEVSWKHPGGKFRRAGPEKCTEAELLAILLNAGTKNRNALSLSQELMDRYANLRGLMGVPLKELMKIKGLGAVKVTQIAAMFEIARRILRHIEAED